MKANVGLILMLLFLVLFQNCSEDDGVRQSQKVQFTFSFSESSLSGGRSASDGIPDGAELILSLTDNSGTPVLTHYRVSILSLGGSYITEPMELEKGSYKLTDFMIALGSDILYATPQKGSPLAPAVIRPLPYSFSVSTNKVKNIEMEVLNVDGYLPEDFGYLSFGINVVNPLRMAVFTTRLGQTTLTAAEAFLYDNGGTLVERFNLGAKINLVSFKGDPDGTYKLVIKKGTYEDYVVNFVYSDLMTQLASLPLKIFLSPTFTIKTTSVLSYEMMLTGTGGVININWGDGVVEPYDFGSDPELHLSHEYDSEGQYTISITGAIDQITEFYAYYGAGPAVDINFKHLVGLKSVRFGLTAGPSVIDLSMNTQLEFINMAGIPQLEELILPSEHNIDFIIVSGPNLFTTPVIDAIINSIHTNAVANHTTGGWFSLSGHWYEEEPEWVGPPSAAGFAKLDALRNDYGWHINE